MTSYIHNCMRHFHIKADQYMKLSYPIRVDAQREKTLLSPIKVEVIIITNRVDESTQALLVVKLYPFF